MRLDTWIRKQRYGALSRLARETGLSYGTIFWAYRRKTRTTYASAVLIEQATGGAVTIAELCGGKPAPRRKRAA